MRNMLSDLLSAIFERVASLLLSAKQYYSILILSNFHCSYKDEILFIDLGANLGQAFSQFNRHFKKFNINFHLFEPNPYCYKELLSKPELQKENITIYNCAVSSRTEKLLFYGLSSKEGGKFAQGGSLLPHHNSLWFNVDRNSSIQVSAIDFSNYLKKQIPLYDKIIVKMDIEGSELEVLESLIENETIKGVQALFVEFHSKYQQQPYSDISLLREEKIIKYLKHNNVKVYIWD